jgi:IgGFc binding protein/CHU_C Type IX secretion signal domain/SprB repeat
VFVKIFVKDFDNRTCFYIAASKLTTMLQRRFFAAVLFIAQAALLSAQLDTIHWIPPMHARSEWGPHFVYLSTPEKQPFEVYIRNGAGVLLATAVISNTKAYRYDMGASNDTPVMVGAGQLNQPLEDKGLVLNGSKQFYASFRVHASSTFHAGDLTCKGRAALGKIFRIGHLVQEIESQGRRSNFVGVMATEDATTVELSGYAAGALFQSGGNGAVSPANGVLHLALSRGESIVFSHYVDVGQPPNGLMGALLTADKPVAVNCGSWIGAPVPSMAHDIGIDQIAPFERVGKEYILCRGNGSSILEHPIIIAHKNNTQIWLNGSTTPTAVLNAGQYDILSTNAYSSAGNLYIRSSEPVFVYQMIGGVPTGGDEARTAGLIFVPPISCGIPNKVDNIYQPNQVGFMHFEGGLMITAMRDSNVTVRVDGVPAFIGAPDAVPGHPDFVTYRSLNLFAAADSPEFISVEAQGAVQVAMYGRNQPASFAAFYSGFSKTNEADISLHVIGDGVCPDTLVALGHFDGVQWMYEDSIVQFGKDTQLITYAPGRYSVNGYLGVCRRTDVASDTADLKFVSPAFPHRIEEPSCYDLPNGKIFIGAPRGGLPPYTYSVDNGAHFSLDPVFDGLHAGIFKLVVRDSKGCYNRPMSLRMGQPDSFTVDLVPRRLSKPLKVGESFELEGIPERPVVQTLWNPNAGECSNCLQAAFSLDESDWITLTVYDSMGCTATDSLLVLVRPNLFAPNVVKPDVGNDNAFFTLYARAPLPMLRLMIFDRWGDEIFERRNIYTNNPKDGWNGRSGDKRVEPGVYVFVAEVETLPGRVETISGDVTVVE